MLNQQRKKELHSNVWQTGVTGDGINTSKRKNKWNGTLMMPGVLITDYLITGLNKTYGRKMMQGDHVLKGLENDTFTGISFNLSIKGPGVKYYDEEGDGRLEAFATYHLSYNGLVRMLKAFKTLLNSPVMKEIIDILESYHKDIVDSVQEYYTLLHSEQGDDDEWERYVKDKSDRANPYTGKHYSTMTTDELRVAKKETDDFIHYMSDDYSSKIADKKQVLKQEGSIDALRSRKGNYQLVKRGDRITAKVDKVRDRSAGGQKYVSQERYALKFNKSKKHKCIAPWYRVARKIAGSESIEFFQETGLSTLLKVMELKQPFYTDLTNGEAQFGNLLSYLGFSQDMSGLPVNEAVQLKGLSGISSTPDLNHLVLSAYHRWLKEEHGIDKYAAFGGDNMVFDFDEEEWNEIGDTGGLDKSDRWLGIKGRKHWPLQLVRDNVDYARSWSSFLINYEGHRSRIGVSKVIQTIIMYDVANMDSAFHLYKWAYSNNELSEKLNSTSDLGSMLEWIEGNIDFNSLQDEFSEEIEWVKRNLAGHVDFKEIDYDDWKWKEPQQKYYGNQTI